MTSLRVFTISTLVFLATSCPLPAQTFVYSGREYLSSGRSWSQIREMNVATGRRAQITTAPHDHWRPWCTPDGRSILFTPGSRRLARFDRVTKRESHAIALEQDFVSVVDALDASLIAVQESSGTIEIVDIENQQKVRSFAGVNLVLTPNRKLMAWQTPVDGVLQRDQLSHVMLAAVSGQTPIDLGPGSGPAFSPDGATLLFTRFDPAGNRIDIVRYNIVANSNVVQPTRNGDFYFAASALSVSPDGTSIILAACCGRYGSELYWRLAANGEWGLVDGNLEVWGGWSRNGRLIYATDGRDLRALDDKRSVWVGDVKLLEQQAAKPRTVVSGISMNEGPRWCSDVPQANRRSSR